MTLAKRLLLGTAAAFVATSGAHAADLGLPVAPSVDYVQICSIGAFTGFILPGGDVCFDIGGHARAQLTWGEEIDDFDFSDSVASEIIIDIPDIAEDDASFDVTIPDISTAAVGDTTTVTIALDPTAGVDEGLEDVLALVYANSDVRAALTAAAAAAGYSSVVGFAPTLPSYTITGTNGGVSVASTNSSNTLLFNQATLGFAADDTLTGFDTLYNGLLTSGTDVDNDEANFLANAVVTFDARTMTEYGLLRGFIEFDGDDDASVDVDKAFVQMNIGSLGFTAGLSSSVFDPIFTGYGSGATNGLDIGDDSTVQFSVNVALGNGVTASLSVEDDDMRQMGIATLSSTRATPTSTTAAYTVGTTTYDNSGVPDIIAAIRVDQAWGSAKLAAALHEVNPVGSTFDSEFGYAVGASAEFNIPVGVGSTFGITGIYAHGAQDFMGFTNVVGNSATPYVDAIAVTTNVTTPATTATSLELTSSYVLAAGFNFGVSEQVALSIDGSYADVDHYGSIFDGNVYHIRGGIAYTPVSNLTLNAHVSYSASDFNTSTLRSSVDDDEWGARFRVTRSF